jgi:hypothetical protein
MSQENVDEVDDPPRRCYKRLMRGVRVVALVVALAALPASGGGAVAAAQPGVPPTLSGESFHQGRPTLTSMNCLGFVPLTFSYSATGSASGPYPGTFSVRGRVTGGETASTSFTIDSPVGRVTGTGSISGPGMSCAGSCLGVLDCADNGGQFGCCGPQYRAVGPYDATITAPTGAFTDSGIFFADLYHGDDPDPLDRFNQSFESSLPAPTPVAPTTKNQCKNGGWREFGFRNQGQCIRFVTHGPK